MKPKGLYNKRVVMIVAPDNFRDEEYMYPREILEAEGVRITVACESTRESRGMLGLKITPQVHIKSIRPKEYDAIIIVGGRGAQEYLWDNDDLHTLIRKADENGKIVAAICLAVGVLAKAGILNGRKATVYKTKESLFELEQGGAQYIAEPLVIDGNIITANGPRIAKEFGSAIAEALR